MIDERCLDWDERRVFAVSKTKNERTSCAEKEKLCTAILREKTPGADRSRRDRMQRSLPLSRLETLRSEGRERERKKKKATQNKMAAAMNKNLKKVPHEATPANRHKKSPNQDSQSNFPHHFSLFFPIEK